MARARNDKTVVEFGTKILRSREMWSTVDGETRRVSMRLRNPAQRRALCAAPCAARDFSALPRFVSIDVNFARNAGQLFSAPSSIQSRIRSISSWDSGGADRGILAPTGGVSELIFRNSKLESGSPGTTSVKSGR